MGETRGFKPGAAWTDTGGCRIEAHGGGILRDGGVYYWFGEHKGGLTTDGPLRRVDVIGVSCYSSRNLLDWHYEGLALPAAEDPASDLHPSRIVERPKVVYNQRTGQYVMWLHVDTADYRYARAGVAVSERPAGPYRYLGSLRPLDMESRDLTVFQDDDGAAYLIHASDGNATMRIVRLSADYLRPSAESAEAFVLRYREAPAICKHGGVYYLITSGCTGWTANEAEYATAPTPLGPWRVWGNPCVGGEEERATTFHAQGTFILPTGDDGRFIFMADRWNSHDLGDSRYIWLPLEIDGGVMKITWLDEWGPGL